MVCLMIGTWNCCQLYWSYGTVKKRLIGLAVCHLDCVLGLDEKITGLKQ